MPKSGYRSLYQAQRRGLQGYERQAERQIQREGLPAAASWPCCETCWVWWGY